jgi:hypothetical protein
MIWSDSISISWTFENLLHAQNQVATYSAYICLLFKKGIRVWKGRQASALDVVALLSTLAGNSDTCRCFCWVVQVF